MPAEILSLDLDWFNRLSTPDLKSGIKDFFVKLNEKCVLPHTAHLVPEHQYLYPWSLKVLKVSSCRKMRIVNIDEHHDFYDLECVDFDYPRAIVGCWNFFAFMVHHKLMSEYTWVTGYDQVVYESADLDKKIRKAKSSLVRSFKKKINVVSAQSVWKVLRNRKFDGFIIVRSPEYTIRRGRVYHAVDEALGRLPLKVKRYKCRKNFSQHRVYARSNSLFHRL